MKVFITQPAKLSCDYYKSEGYTTYAIKLRKSVIRKAKSLSTHHYRGQKEELLKPLNQGHRCLLVEGHYKLIYLVEKQRVIITDVFDTRQQPKKMLKRHQ